MPHVPLEPGRAARLGLPGPALAGLYIVLALAPLAAALFFGYHRPPNLMVSLARAAGIAASAMLLLQFVTSGRFETISGRIGLDKTMGFHRFAAIVAVVMALAHVVFIVLRRPNWTLDRFVTRLIDLLGNPAYLNGTVALGLFILITLVAKYLRGRLAPYPLWRLSHGMLAVVAVGFATLHVRDNIHVLATPVAQLIVLALLAVATGAVAIIYVLRPLQAYGRGFAVKRARRLSPAISELILTAPETARFRFAAGQFAWLAIGGRHTVTDNPFSIASAPAGLPELRFLIRDAGDLTHTIPDLTPGTKVGIDGPHGSFVLPEGDGPLLFLAGGIGIAPVLALVRHLAETGDTRPVRLIAAARIAADHVVREEILELGKRLDFKSLFLTDDEAAGPGCEAGRCEANHIARVAGGIDLARTTAFVCGPPPMMTRAVELLRDAGVPDRAIVMEQFDYDAARDAVSRAVRRRFLLTLAALFVLTGIAGVIMTR